MPSRDRKQAKILRFNRIAGQVRGIGQMIEGERYCIDIIDQIRAVKAALGRAESEVLRDHAACCVAEAMTSGNARDRRTKVDELVDLFDRARR